MILEDMIGVSFVLVMQVEEDRWRRKAEGYWRRLHGKMEGSGREQAAQAIGRPRFREPCGDGGCFAGDAQPSWTFR